MESHIFVTRGGPYADVYVEGTNEMIWKGQNNGTRDNRVTRGTNVWYRNDKRNMAFKLIGIVEKKTLESIGDKTRRVPATYKLRLHLFDVTNQIVIRRADGDRTTHQTILRMSGFPENVVNDAGRWPHGIY